MAKKSHRVRRVLLPVLAVFFLGTLLFSLYMLLRMRAAYREADELRQALEPYRPVMTESAEAEEDPAGSGAVRPDRRWLWQYILPDETPEAVDERILQIRALQAEYPDVAGWISIPGTQIDYPFVRGPDNDYYLHRDLKGGYLYSGTIFLDWRCEKDLSGDNSILYGHHMKNGTMFNNLNRFLDRSYLTEHAEIWLVLPDRIVKATAFAALLVDPDDCAFLYEPAVSEDRLSRIRRNAYVYFDPSVPEPELRYLTLSTCSFAFDGARTVVVAYLDPDTN